MARCFTHSSWSRCGWSLKGTPFPFRTGTICDLHVFTTSGNNLSLIRQALHRCSSIYFTSSLWNRAQFVALKESVKFEIHWNTMKYIWNIFSNLLSFCEWNSWMELLTRLLQLQERDFGNWHYLCSALVNEIFARLLFHFSICFYKISQDYMIQMIRFHKSDSSFFGALQISTRQEMLFRDLRPCVSAKQWNVEDGFIWFISLQARSKVILAFEDEQRCVNMYLWSPLDPTKIDFFSLVKWTLVHETPLTHWHMLDHVGMLVLQWFPAASVRPDLMPPAMPPYYTHFEDQMLQLTQLECSKLHFLPQCKDVWSSLVYDVDIHTYTPLKPFQWHPVCGWRTHFVKL